VSGRYEMILIVVKWTIRPEHAETFLDRVAGFTAGTRGEPGNLFFEWNRNVDDPNVFTLVEGFRDDAAEAHVTSDHFKAAMAWLPDVVARKPDIINTTIPQDGWSEMAEVSPR
jgi:quinol monooxygenase YgiN